MRVRSLAVFVLAVAFVACKDVTGVRHDTTFVQSPPDTVVDTLVDTLNVPSPPDTVEVPSPPDTVEVPSPPDTVEVPSPPDTVEVPSPPDTVTQVDTVIPVNTGGWQVTIKPEFSGGARVSAGVASNPSTGITFSDFFLAEPGVIDIPGNGDTVYLAISTQHEFFAAAMLKEYTLSGSLTPMTSDSSKIWIGEFKSIRYIETFNEFFFPTGSAESQHPIDVDGWNFVSHDTVDFGGATTVKVTNLFYLPIVCKQAGVRKLISGDIQSHEDYESGTSDQTFLLAHMTVTCNPALSALRASNSSEKRVRLIDALKSLPRQSK